MKVRGYEGGQWVEAPVIVRRPSVTIREAAALCRVSRRSIYSWIAQGKVETWRTPGGHQRVFTDSLVREEA